MNREEQKAKPEDQLNGEEVAKHDNKDSCWVIVHGRVYDVTEVRFRTCCFPLAPFSSNFVV